MKRISFAMAGLMRRSSKANVTVEGEDSDASVANKRRSFAIPGLSRHSSKANVTADREDNDPPAPTKRLSFVISGLSRRNSSASVAITNAEASASLSLSLDALLPDDESERAPSPGQRLSMCGIVAALSRRASREVVEPDFKPLDEAFEEQMQEGSHTAAPSKQKRPSLTGKGRTSPQLSVGDTGEARTSVDSQAGASAQDGKRQSWDGLLKRTSQAHRYSAPEVEEPPTSVEPSPTKRVSSKWNSQEAEAASVARLSKGGRRPSHFRKKDSVEEIPLLHEAKLEEEPSQVVEPPQPLVTTEEGRRARAHSRWRFLRSTIIIGLRLIHHLYDVRAAREAVSYTAKLPKNVKLKVKSEKQRRELCLTLQGDEDLYKEDVLRMRLQLRHDPAVLEALHEFWATAQRSVQQAATRAEASDLKKREYIKIMVLVGKAMLKDFFEVEARHEAEKDWAEDAKDPNAKSITREAFMDAIFQLADHWTPGVSSQEYSSFLWRLLKRISISEAGKSGLFWRQPADVRYMDPEARPAPSTDERLAPAPSGPKKTASSSRISESGAPAMGKAGAGIEPVRKLSTALNFVQRAARRPPSPPTPVLSASSRAATDRQLMPVAIAAPDMAATRKAASDRNIMPTHTASAARLPTPTTSPSLPPLTPLANGLPPLANGLLPPARGAVRPGSSRMLAQRGAFEANQMDTSTAANVAAALNESSGGRATRSSSTTLTKLTSSPSKAGLLARKPSLAMSMPTGSAQFDMSAFGPAVPARRGRGINSRIPI
jgi:hypothetical protein